MRFESLEMFLSVVDGGSLAAAARALHLSQSAVSKAISALEAEMGEPLLLREPGQRKPIRATAAGEIVVHHARLICKQYRQLAMELAMRHDPLNPFVIGTSPTTSSSLLPLLLKQFKELYPQFSVRTSAFISSTVHSKLLERECDIAISSTLPIKGEAVICEKFFYDPLVLVVPKSLNSGHERRDWLTVEELMKLPLLIREQQCNVTRMITEALQLHGKTMENLTVAAQVFGNAAVMKAVKLGTGAGFVTESIVATDSEVRNYEIMRVRGMRLDRYLYLLRRKYDDFSLGMKMFWDFAKSSVWHASLGA